MDLLARKLIHRRAQNPADIILQNQLPLIESFQQSPPHSVHGLALLVHYVVVLKQMFAALKVLRFHCLLRALNAIRNHLRLDRNAFFHAQLLQQRADPLLGEDPHQIVFKRQIEPRFARIALPSGTTSQLVVDAPRLMPLCSQNE